MENEICYKIWKFDIEVNGPSHLLISNPSLLNILSSGFISSCDQVLLKITCNESVEVTILTNCQEAEKSLLKRFSEGTILNDLLMINFSFSDISISKLRLVQTGFLLDNGDIDFHSIKSEVDSFLCENSSFLAQSQLSLTKSIDFHHIITEHLDESAVDILLKNSLTISSKAPCSSCVEKASSSFCENSEESFSIADSTLTPKDFSHCHDISLHGACKNGSVSDVEIEDLQLRDYQQELAEPGLKGKNCIILAPTGSGKTIVAAQICKNFVAKNDPRKVLFLVPRVPLVQQQYNVLKRFVDDIYQVSGESASRVPVSVLIEQHLVSVMTAQIFLNLLKANQISFESIGLVIFDECHHAMKKHVYNKIMHFYMNLRYSSQPSPKLPQIIGLSASPGVGKAKAVEKAEENIKTLMANLDVTLAPVEVVQHVASLRKFQNSNRDEVKVVDRLLDDGFANSIRAAMREIEHLFCDCKDKFYNVLDLQNIPELMGSHGRQDYEAWTVTLHDYGKKVKHVEASRWLMAISFHLRIYNNGLIIHDHVRSSDVKAYLEKTLLGDSAQNDVVKRLKKIFIKHAPKPTVDKNPLLEELRLILISQYTKKPTSRCIVFVKTREIAQAVINYLKEADGLLSFRLNSLLMTGTHAKCAMHGMTKSSQYDALKAFREGKSKVLVATSVAEEGLDIKACNMIITYNYSTNEVGKIQRKGRGRAEDSRMVILAYRDSGHIEREQINDFRVRLSRDVLSKLRNMDPHQLKCEISKLQLKTKEERDSEAEMSQPRWTRDRQVYSLLCVGCKRPITTSDKIRSINKQHHLAIDPELKRRSEVVPLYPELEFDEDVFLNGKRLCRYADCRTEWGPCMIHKKVPIAVLKIKSILLVKNDETPIAVKQWSNVPFYSVVPELNPQEWKDSLDPCSSDEDDFSFDEAALNAALNISSK